MKPKVKHRAGSNLVRGGSPNDRGPFSYPAPSDPSYHRTPEGRAAQPSCTEGVTLHHRGEAFIEMPHRSSMKISALEQLPILVMSATHCKLRPEYHAAPNNTTMMQRCQRARQVQGMLHRLHYMYHFVS